jgi:hypothetical protein
MATLTGAGRRLIAGVLAWVWVGVGGLHAQPPRPTEYQVKAAYLYNFSQFIEWPANASAEDAFAICVLGQDPFGPILDAALAGLSIDGKSVVTRRLAKPQEGTGCRILFISSSEEQRLKETLTALGKNSVLTVSDIPQFAQRGGVIQFVLAGNRVRFEINLTIAQHAGLILSSDLLKVAVAVRKDVRPGG